MSARRRGGSAARTGRADALLTAGVLIGLVAALLPVTRVVAPGGWLVGAIGLLVAIMATGYVLRRTRMPALGVTAVEVALTIAVVTVVFVRDSAFLGIVPLAASAQEAAALVATASEQIIYGVAPLQPTPALGFVIVGLAALFTIAVDHIALTARMPLLAGVALFTVSLIPTLAVPGAMNVGSFVLLAAAILILLRAETRRREPATGRTTGASVLAAGIGVVAVVAALVVTPALPQPGPRAGSGTGARGIDASLALGEDLRRPDEVEVLQMRTSAPQPPYLRVATLSEFTGSVWQPDRMWALPLDSDAALGEVETGPGVALGEYDTSIEIAELSSDRLPVPFPAVEVDGLTGSWEAVPLNRTIVGEAGATVGQTYDVRTRVPEPTLEQIRSADANPARVRDSASELPRNLPEIIAQTADEITAGTRNDYDALIAMQSWFRGSDFRYSLDAPVEQGFDGSGADAVAAFLEVKAGYCVHYASAFALMARTLGMPARIVVGYLPGTNTSTVVDGQTVRSVMSSQLHAWPEVFFDGIGWVPFEPTNSLGTATRFGAANEATDQRTASPSPTTTTTRSPSPSPTATSRADQTDAPNAAPNLPAQRNTAILAWVGAILGILALLSAPAAAAALRRRRLFTAAGRDDAVAAWMLVQDTALDLGIPMPPGDSPRALGSRLVQAHGAPDAPMQTLVAAIEQSSYAPAPDGADRRAAERLSPSTTILADRGTTALADPGTRVADPGARVAEPGAHLAQSARTVRGEMMLAATPHQRTVALLLPRSLLHRWSALRRVDTA